MKNALRTMAAICFAAATILTAHGASAFMPGPAAETARTDVTLVAMPQKKPPKKYWRTKIKLKTDEAPGTIIVDTNNKYLYYVEGPNKATRYGIGVGREGFGWSGVVKVGRKAEWPSWTPTANMIRRDPERNLRYAGGVPGGLHNPLGARAVYLYRNGHDTMFRIHGTNQPQTIGQAVSSGCIRMLNHDVIDLYERAEVGGRVIVLQA